MRAISGTRCWGLALVAGWLAACSDGGGGSPPPPPTPAFLGSFQPGADIVAGHGPRVVAWGWPSASVYSQDATDPTLLAKEATLPDCDCNVRFVALNDQWIALAGEQWVTYTPVALVGYVQLARAGGPYSASRIVQLPGWTAVDRATAWNDRLVAASATSIRLYDIGALASPVLLGELDAGANSTAIAAAGGGVFVFNENGYVFVDLAAGTFSSTEAPDLAGVDRADASGGKLRVGGRSKYAGYYRVARLDPSAAPALAIEADANRIVDANAPSGDVGDMSFDAARGQYVLLSQTQPYPRSGEAPTSLLLRYSDGASIAPIDDLVLQRPVCFTDCPATMNVAPRLHANAGIVYVIPDPSASNVPVYGYRLP